MIRKKSVKHNIKQKPKFYLPTSQLFYVIPRAKQIDFLGASCTTEKYHLGEGWNTQRKLRAFFCNMFKASLMIIIYKQFIVICNQDNKLGSLYVNYYRRGICLQKHTSRLCFKKLCFQHLTSNSSRCQFI